MRNQHWIAVALICVALSGPLKAAEAPVAPAEASSTATEKALAQAPSWMRELLTDPLFITIAFLMGSTLIGAFLKGRARDTCLKSLHGGLVHVQLKDGRVIYGTLYLGNSGLEIVFEKSRGDDGESVNRSYLMYKSEYGQIQAVVRYLSELNETQRKDRQKTLRRSRNPGFLWRTLRRIHNIVKTIKDALNETFGLVLGRVKGAQGAEVVKKQEKYIKQAQKEMSTAVTAASFDVLLEKLLGRRVIVELNRGDTQEELNGVFCDYTAAYMELMDVTERRPFEIAVKKDATIEPEKGQPLRIEWSGGEMTVTNKGRSPVNLEMLVADGDERAFDPPVSLKPKATHTETVDADACTLRGTAFKTADMVLPRTLAVVRHRAEKDE